MAALEAPGGSARKPATVAESTDISSGPVSNAVVVRRCCPSLDVFCLVGSFLVVEVPPCGQGGGGGLLRAIVFSVLFQTLQVFIKLAADALGCAILLTQISKNLTVGLQEG